jgi:hypothetical protein
MRVWRAGPEVGLERRVQGARQSRLQRPPGYTTHWEELPLVKAA